MSAVVGGSNMVRGVEKKKVGEEDLTDYCKKMAEKRIYEWLKTVKGKKRWSRRGGGGAE